ncbi:MAG: Vitamin B12 import ATP-binding protein BtuD [Gammaproteobacteria bacterium]|nr:Vitamin B12 import ATP-binding protein BtuD [Gammaproteobacteria bacterium]
MTLEVRVHRRLGEFEIDVDFRAGPGITALFGRSGCGKTSIVNMIAGLLKPDRGRISVDGRALYDSNLGLDIPVHRRRVACVFQDARLFPNLTVRKNLLYGLRLAPRKARFTSFDHVVELLGIAALLDRRPGALSGGEKQRVAIGRALLTSPGILLMDEPLASLDAQRKAEIVPYIERLRRDFGLSMVYVSHAIEEVLRLADTVVMLQEGKVSAVGPLEETLGRIELYPVMGRKEAGSALATIVIAHDDTDALTTLRFDGGTLQIPRVNLPTGTHLRIHVRARDVALAVQRPDGISIRNILPGRVTEMADSAGAYVEVKVAIGGSSLVSRITRQAARELTVAIGHDVYLLIKSIAIDTNSLGILPPADYLPRITATARETIPGARSGEGEELLDVPLH